MSLEWNVVEDISTFYRYCNGVWTRYLYYQTDDGIDLFCDNFQVGDALYFINHGYPSNNCHAHKFKGLKLNIDVPISATGYSYVWEYYSRTAGWTALSGVNDPSNGLQNAGIHEITWDMPTDWRAVYKPCNNDYWSSGYSVRLRVVAVTSMTEGGKHATETMKQFNYAYHIADGNEYTPEDIYNYDNSLGNGLIEKTNDDLYYLINANVIVDNGKLTIPFKTRLTIGKEPMAGYEAFEIIIRDNGELNMDGSFLKWNNGFSTGQYLYWNGKLTMKNAARIWRYGYGYVGCTIAGELNVQDSQFTMVDTSAFYLHGNSHGEMSRSNVATYSFYVYTGRVSFDDVQQVTNADRSSNYQLLGGTSAKYARFKGFDFRNNILLNATQGQEFWAINPVNFNSSKISLGSTYGKKSNYIIIAYEINIKVIDSSGNPIEGARVYLRDTNNHTGWIHDWLQTDGYNIYSLNDKDDTDGYFRKYTDNSYSGGSYTKPPWVDVGTIIRGRGEYIKINSIAGNGHFTCDRNQTYNGYTSLGLGALSDAPLYSEDEYLETDSNGEVYYTGGFGTFTPLVITDIYSEDQDDTRKDRSYNPFTIRVEKTGYKVYEALLNITEATSLIVSLEKAKVLTDQEVLV